MALLSNSIENLGTDSNRMLSYPIKVSNPTFRLSKKTYRKYHTHITQMCFTSSLRQQGVRSPRILTETRDN
jgi:hypothetical protein